MPRRLSEVLIAMTPLTLATVVASAFVPGTPAAAAVARTGIVMSFSWVPPRYSNAARRAIGVPSEEFAARRALRCEAGIDGFHADDSAVLEAATEGDEIDHLENLYAPPVTDICTFGHDAPLPAMSVDDLPAPPKKGLFDQLLDNLPLPLDRQLVNAAKAVQASLEKR